MVSGLGTGLWTKLTDRTVVSVRGPDARHFIQNLVTCDVEKLRPGDAAYGALLTPQGRLQFDFILFAEADGFLVDILKVIAGDFIKRLGFYRLRAAVDIKDRSAELVVVALWDGAALPGVVASAVDPRLPALGTRTIVAAGGDFTPSGTEVDASAYARHRIGLGVPEGGADFDYGEVFPHDADVDQLGGVAFDKGCFVGQEVVSRMEHRGTARRRLIVAKADAPLEPGADLLAGDQAIGTIGSVAGNVGLANVRLDRAANAMAAGQGFTVNRKAVELVIPGWARFDWPAHADGG
jgi:folate-binding protein YgfZ